MKNKAISALAIGIVVVAIVAVAGYIFYTQLPSLSASQATVSQAQNQASSALDQQLSQVTSGISNQDILNVLNSP